MTYHCYSDWDFDDEPTDEIVEEVVKGLKHNKKYNGGEYYTPAAYMTLSAVDQLIFQCGKFLDTHEGQGPITEEAIERFLQKAPESGKVIARKVIAELKKWHQ